MTQAVVYIFLGFNIFLHFIALFPITQAIAIL